MAKVKLRKPERTIGDALPNIENVTQKNPTGAV